MSETVEEFLPSHRAYVDHLERHGWAYGYVGMRCSMTTCSGTQQWEWVPMVAMGTVIYGWRRLVE